MSALHENREAATVAAEKIKIFAQPQRLMILSCLLRGERNVGEIADVTGIGQPALSQQLAELRRADLVQTRKEAKLVWYMLADDNVALCVRNIEAIFGSEGNPVLPPAAKPASQLPPARGVAGFARVL
ncbi:metalloregulator ArsR/SmtB family transcription factor [Sphingobium sp. JS3065]|jgi:DNA-binding transcriptional ArsR family regulator|uniref:ArsR/SmtB family transcription factor n=1 Tax=Sphingobium sp. JS3065 TaxID=2970925 RepID=UPI002263D069|nr:metalloregulator ArsR/SmtB family transcription factor [Sphingobium sp. JS3065]UZW54519.1 metalloregulator ArsR/SmtB family transcription factor [Sphingobium sp. JS3065]